jgi:hypothetical protein
VPDDDHLGALVADLGKAVEVAEEGAPLPLRLDDDHVRRRRMAIGFDGGRAAAHLDLDVRLLHAPVARRGLDRLGDLCGLAERLDGDPRNRRDHAIWLVARLSHDRSPPT